MTKNMYTFSKKKAEWRQTIRSKDGRLFIGQPVASCYVVDNFGDFSFLRILVYKERGGKEWLVADEKVGIWIASGATREGALEAASRVLRGYGHKRVQKCYDKLLKEIEEKGLERNP